MTKETRIGLLVGLVFIVMFGLVLSELTGKSPSTPPRVTMDSPDSAKAYKLPPLEEYSAAAPSPAPAAPRDAAPSTDMVALVPPPADGAPSVIRSLTLPPQDTPRGPSEVRITMDPTRATMVSGTPTAPLPVATPDFKVYVVQDKDTLIKIARKVYGPTHEGEYKKILQANSDVLKDEKGLKLGMKLKVPNLPDSAAPAAAPVAIAAAPSAPSAPSVTTPVSGGPVVEDMNALRARFTSSATTRPATEVASTRAIPGSRTYTVQRGDTLSTIARKMLKDDSRASIDKIVKANKIDTPDRLIVGAELSIPG